ncbi:MAG TPA: UDP-N-acetylglucosamine 2-epimerase (non-hydrolyzing) [Sedimentisphaerales bacterium]|jgi:UDP-N-acetylglucosamine 2-epimerase (non-hydrolysing)|nr:UDP-N-acetylglucosamine 2-epimerase (non-hydrolyzing) [Sedimentisphaerales bacterium]HNU31206.1 UDP-N-acetylglucosamine 2-epimerase (non-hydrolyzing) [Sedimentisphaerales bacterium]
MSKILLVVGARPNFMKMAPLYFEMVKAEGLAPSIVHTGQHYDYAMSQAFFEDLELPQPDFFLGAGSGSHAEQTARIMVEFEKVLLAQRPDLVVVFGDVNSTVACSLTAKKLLVPVAHVEAGLRSFDETMPEEINRRVTDAISDLLFTPSPDGDENLIREGVARHKIHQVGNIMIDSLRTILAKIDQDHQDRIVGQFGVRKGRYVLVTLHRPSNVDDRQGLEQILTYLGRLSGQIPVIFPMHPRTRKNVENLCIEASSPDSLRIVEPVRYREFITLERNARFILTDSGGIQEETTYLGLPCLTLRPNTERPVTITEGTNELVDMTNIEKHTANILAGQWKQGKVPSQWDGRTAERITKVVADSSS